MSTRRMANDQRGISPLLLLFLALIVLSGPLYAVMSTPAGRVKTTNHAVKRHGAEAVAIRDCLERNGVSETWVDPERSDIEYWCVELDQPPYCGKIGILIAQVWPSLVDGCDFRERSSYIPRDGSPARVRDYLSRIADKID